jgi:hypothetical protein
MGNAKTSAGFLQLGALANSELGRGLLLWNPVLHLRFSVLSLIFKVNWRVAVRFPAPDYA